MPLWIVKTISFFEGIIVKKFRFLAFEARRLTGLLVLSGVDT
jgi:hypothetical protein